MQQADNEDARRKNREKQRRFRARHKARLALQAQRRALEYRRNPQASKAKWRLFERTEPRGETADVVLVRDGEQVPSGYAAGGWLPSLLLTFHLARSLAAARRRQIRDWLAERRR
jgi:hypothetical protein